MNKNSQFTPSQRLAHYVKVLEMAKNNYPKGIYHFCTAILIVAGESQSNGICDLAQLNIVVDYPEFFIQKPISASYYGSWFMFNDDRIRAIESAIELVKQEIRNGLH